MYWRKHFVRGVRPISANATCQPSDTRISFSPAHLRDGRTTAVPGVEGRVHACEYKIAQLMQRMSGNGWNRLGMLPINGVRSLTQIEAGCILSLLANLDSI